MNQGQSDFSRVYAEHVSRVYGFVAYGVPSREAAEDLTQMTFERALRAWSRFDPRRGSESTWLLTIARNLVIDHHRRDRSSLHQPIEEDVMPAADGPQERFGTSPVLIDALGELGQREREVLALRFGGDLNGPEIAAMLGLSLANVQQILSRSLRKLRVMLEAGGTQRAEAARSESAEAVRSKST